MSDQETPKNDPSSEQAQSEPLTATELEARADELLAKAAAAQESVAGEAEDTRSEEEKIADAMEALVAENAELKDRLLRSVAEVENIRRRSEREKADAAKYGATNFARSVLSVSDNLRRAIDAVPDDRKDGSDEVVKSIIDGIEIVERSLIAAFEQNGITQVNPVVGEKFNANLHEALFEVPGTGQPGGSIVQVLDIGYMIGERLLRAARVGVAKAGDDTPPGGKIDTTA